MKAIMPAAGIKNAAIQVLAGLAMVASVNASVFLGGVTVSGSRYCDFEGTLEAEWSNMGGGVGVDSPYPPNEWTTITILREDLPIGWMAALTDGVDGWNRFYGAHETAEYEDIFPGASAGTESLNDSQLSSRSSAPFDFKGYQIDRLVVSFDQGDCRGEYGSYSVSWSLYGSELSNIPEPSRAVIGLLGLMGVVVCHRRRRA